MTKDNNIESIYAGVDDFNEKFKSSLKASSTNMVHKIAVNGTVYSVVSDEFIDAVNTKFSELENKLAALTRSVGNTERLAKRAGRTNTEEF